MTLLNVDKPWIANIRSFFKGVEFLQIADKIGVQSHQKSQTLLGKLKGPNIIALGYSAALYNKCLSFSIFRNILCHRVPKNLKEGNFYICQRDGGAAWCK